jgi:hypothetical protein
MILSIGYDEKTKTLEIEFNTGHIYEYYDFPKKEYEELMDSTSLGRYFLENIKEIYRYSQIK